MRRSGALAIVPPAGPPRHGGGGGDSGGPDDGEDVPAVVGELNARHAVVLLGGEPAVLEEYDACDVDPRSGEDRCRPAFRLFSPRSFKEWHRRRRVMHRGRWVNIAERWMNHPRCREFPNGLVFRPAPPGVRPTVAGAYNLWRGFAVAADAAPAPETRCAHFLAHLRDVVCNGDAALTAWVLAWLAALVQRPTDRMSTALVLLGGQGSGKTVLHEMMARLLGAHALIVSDLSRVTGRFNGHLANVLFLTLDECTWGGDHSAAGRLKDYISGGKLFVEYKGKEPVTVDNYARVLITSNNAWVVPAGLDERRFCVLRLDDARQQDAAYFAPIWEEVRGEGAAAFLAYLLTVDTGAVNLRTVPTTEALVEQQLASLPSDAAFWRDVLERGVLPGDKDGEGATRTHVLHDAYVAHAKAVGVPRRSTEVQLGTYLKRVVPGIGRRRVRIARADGTKEESHVYAFPSLADCRKAFARQFAGHAGAAATAWDDPGAEWAPDTAPAPERR